MLNRRAALKVISLSSAALLAKRWLATPAQAQIASPAPVPATGPFTLPPLPYPASALEPHIDAQTMEIHHGKHHAAYVNNLNKALAVHPDLATQPVDTLLRDWQTLPADIQTAVRNNGGGHANHSLFWNSLSPEGGQPPEGALADALASAFASFAGFQERMANTALSQFGSGWAWLALDADRALIVEGLPNQDSPLMFGRQPLFGIDVWEHAYYLRYQNRRADYVKALWNVVNWPAIGQRYQELMGA